MPVRRTRRCVRLERLESAVRGMSRRDLESAVKSSITSVVSSLR